MARPEVKGLKYFPFDVGFFADKKIRLLKGACGSDGIELYIRLLTKIYQDNGYYLPWDNEADFALLAEETGFTEDKVRLILAHLLKRSLFEDTLLLRVNVLSSRSIQRRYFSAISETRIKAASKGRHTAIDKDLCLLTEEDFSELNKNGNWLKVAHNSDKSANNSDISTNNLDKSANNPAKKSKVKKSKEKKSTRVSAPPTLAEVAEYCKNRNSSVDPKKFYEYYDAGSWVDRNGNKVRNWKQKLITWEGRNRNEPISGNAQTKSEADNPFTGGEFI